VDRAEAGLAGSHHCGRAGEPRQPAEPRPVVVRGLLADERAPLVRVLVREQDVEPHVGIAVERVPVGEGELRALGDDVDERGLGELLEIEALQKRELQANRACSPRARLADGEPAVVERDDGLERRVPGGHVLAGEEASLCRAEAVDLLRDEALVESAASALDLLLPRSAPALVDNSPVRRRQRAVPEETARARWRQVERRRALPAFDQLSIELNRLDDPLDERVAVPRVPDREGEDVLETPGPELAQEEEPAAECARYAAARTPVPGISSCPRSRNRSILAAAGATPWPQSASGSPRSADQKTADTSPPGPFRCGSTTWRTNPVATAASKAFPPRSSTDIPAAEASQCVDATIPKVPRSSGLVVNTLSKLQVVTWPSGRFGCGTRPSDKLSLGTDEPSRARRTL